MAGCCASTEPRPKEICSGVDCCCVAEEVQPSPHGKHEHKFAPEQAVKSNKLLAVVQNGMIDDCISFISTSLPIKDTSVSH